MDRPGKFESSSPPDFTGNWDDLTRWMDRIRVGQDRRANNGRKTGRDAARAELIDRAKREFLRRVELESQIPITERVPEYVQVIEDGRYVGLARADEKERS